MAGDPIEKTGHMRLPGTISLPSEVFLGVIRGVALSAISAGFKNVYVLGDHGGGQSELRLAAETLDADWRGKGVHVYYISNTGAGQKVNAYLAERKIAPGGHAGVAESAQVMFLDQQKLMRKDKLLGGGCGSRERDRHQRRSGSGHRRNGQGVPRHQSDGRRRTDPQSHDGHQVMPMRRWSQVATAVTIAICAAVLRRTGVAAVPRHRGRRGGGRSRAARHLERRPRTSSGRDRCPGIGWSSPVVWGDHVFVTTVVNTGAAGAAEARASTLRRLAGVAGAAPLDGLRHRLRDRQGALGAGSAAARRRARPKHLKNSYASETPVTDGERVYFYFGNVGLFAFDMKGKPVWSKPLGPFKTRNGWGTAASPVLHRDRLYIVNDNDEQSFLAAYDKRTGAEVWRVEPRGGHQLVDAVRLGERAAHRDRDVGLRAACGRTI